ncbi:hypothetical protein JRC04_04985 [Mycolicibacterium sp. S2-37]|uniref:hypothetical protein n=1 Tax=Mycolicibacterium sp. S2-37 TaxID=2810297 RepID=UPI001A942417|nr:hypothetical protein [Mycolicibacterium sp. S2-37]MBO0676812.1 hypothetical protein [Mycolicibacterium sp. S2-37]
MNEPTEKQCSSCRQTKPLDEFYSAATGKYGRKSICKTCTLDKQRGTSKVQRSGPPPVDLKAIRNAAGMSLWDMARALGMTARSGDVNVSQIEKRKDWKLSSLLNYFRAAGAEAELVVTVRGKTLRFNLLGVDT